VEAFRFARVVAALDDHAPGVQVERLDIDASAGVVTVWTRYPGLLIGRRGATADSIRQSIRDALGIESVKLAIIEVRPQEPEDPEDGVREPRRPRPPSPTTGEQLDTTR
jgi:hypothetical protein